MPIESPKERVYYYECSYGKFRLSYFIPYGELEKLSKKNKIDKQVLKDFPDGVDLRVGENDYADFKKLYGYRPDVDPDVAKGVFYSILSTTKNWKKFRGSDIILATEIEKRIDSIEEKMKDEKNKSFVDISKTSREKLKRKKLYRRVRPEKAERKEKVDLKTYRRLRKRQAREQEDVNSFLRKFKPEGIDPTQTLRDQKFPKPEWTKGDKIEEMFARVQHRRMRKEGERP